MNKWIIAGTSAVLITSLAGCNSGSSKRDDAQPTPPEVQTPTSISLNFLGRHSAGEFAVSAAEIPVFDRINKRIFVANALNGAVDVLDADTLDINPDPTLVTSLTVSDLITSLSATDIGAGAEVNSVAYYDDDRNGLLAVAIASTPKTDAGFAALYDARSLEPLGYTKIGALPDMLTFTPDGKYLLVANEGEPNDDYSIDPEGSVSVIAILTSENGDKSLGENRTADFLAFNEHKQALIEAGVRIFGPADPTLPYGPDNITSVAQDLEPEYITVSADGSTAWIALQENNALARLDIENARITDIMPFGYKDHGLEGNGMDVSDRDSTDGQGNPHINISTWPGVLGMYHPDGIASYQVDGVSYIVTANEGDARAWGEDNSAYWYDLNDPSGNNASSRGDSSLGFVEEIRAKHLVHHNGFMRRVRAADADMPPQLHQLAAGALLNPDVFGYCGAGADRGRAGDCREDTHLGRLLVSWVDGYRKYPDGSPELYRLDASYNPVLDASLTADDGFLMYDRLYAFGARSFAIWKESGNTDGARQLELVWDSGDQFEQYIASDGCLAGSARDIPCKDFFNSHHSEGSALDNRSDNKGPEPEGIRLGQLGDKTFAFIGLERMGGVMVYDISKPSEPAFVDYLNTREEWVNTAPGQDDAQYVDPQTYLAEVGDLGAEGIEFVSAEHSPTGKPLVIVGNEVSGTTSVYEVEQSFAD